MEVRFLVDIDPAQKTGLFNAVVARVACLPESTNYNLSYFDTTTVRLLKKMFGFRPKEKKQRFIFDGVVFTPLHVKADVLHYLAKLIGPLVPAVFRRDSKRIRKSIDPGQYILSAHWGNTAGVIAYYICRHTKMKYVVTYHGSDINNIKRKGVWLERLVLKSLHDSEINIFVSKALLEEAQQLGYEAQNSVVIYNGVDREKFGGQGDPGGVQRSQAIRELCEGSPVVGYVGNMLRVKGADYLPDICKEILAQEPNVKFIFAGNGEFLETVKSGVSAENSIILGEVDPADIVHVMRLIDVLMIPSRSEGLPLVLLEALASGIRVTASKVGGIPEILPAECLVELGHDFVGRFAKKVVSMLNSHSHCELKRCFDWRVIREQERQVYREIESKYR